jgi:two-component system response regulator YesN
MNTLVIIDDEEFIRYLLKNIIDWNRLGFELIGEAKNSIEALELLEENPDLALIDIKLPGMSGIELCKRIKEDGFTTHVLIISGYSDFEYARQAIAYPFVHNYILKPVDADELESSVKEVTEQLNHQKISNITNNINFLSHIFSVSGDNGSKARDLLFNKKRIYDKYLVYITSKHLANYPVESVNHPEENEVILELNNDRLCFILNYECPQAEIYNKIKKVSPLIGISPSTGNFSNIEKLYYQADVAYNTLCFYNATGILDANIKKEQRVIVMSQIKQIGEAFINLNFGLYQQLIKNICKYFYENKISIEYVAWLYNYMLMLSVSQKADDNPNTAEFFYYHNIIANYSNIEELCDILCSLFLMPGDSPDLSDGLTGEVLEYINDNIRDSSLLLGDIAKKFHISISHLSKHIKNYTGITFTEYITKKRMEEAASLLLKSDQTIIEISEYVGYNDYFYFNKVFKRYFGITPSKYRRSNRVKV